MFRLMRQSNVGISMSFVVACVLSGLLLLAGCGRAKVSDVYAPVSWSDLPGVDDADLLAGFAAWRAGCEKLEADVVWMQTCLAASDVAASPTAVRAFLQSRMDVFALGGSGAADGLITGYYEPVYPGSPTRSNEATVPVYAVPEDLVAIALDDIHPGLNAKRLRGRLEGDKVVPYYDAATIARHGVNARILAWLTDPMDLQFLQIQGSGRIRLFDGRQLRVGYADQNGHPYRPIGKWLVDQGELNLDDVNMQTIRAWAKAHPARVTELLASNPSYVFFKQRPDGAEGPIGSFGVPMAAGYSAAVDRRAIPLGSLVWLSTTTPDGAALTRPIAAHDTGGAISGNARIDLFTGTGEAAGELAGRMKQQGRLWLLWPKAKALPFDPVAADKRSPTG